ncbi:MAG TPA: thioesterase family protein [Gemmatimonadaceae bacterium]|nr:thioesterase family protein [Gemmatimonadaceae bacterium]
MPISKPAPVAVDLRVRYAETDQMGVVYHANYLVWCEIGRVEFIRALGTSYASLERSGVTLAVAEASVRYHAPARYDDLVRVETSLADVRSRTITFDYLISHAETRGRLATARTTLICLDSGGRPSVMPDSLRAALGSPAR